MGTLALLLMCCFAAMVYTISGDEVADTADDMVGKPADDAIPQEQPGANGKVAAAIDLHQKALIEAKLNAKNGDEDCDEEKQDLKNELDAQIEELEKRLDKMKDQAASLGEEEDCDAETKVLKKELIAQIKELEKELEKMRELVNEKLQPQPPIHPPPYHDQTDYLSCWKNCCDNRTFEMNLQDGHIYASPDIPGVIDILQFPTAQFAFSNLSDCHSTALFKIKFDNITQEPCPGICMTGPSCDRKFLRLDFNLSMNDRSSGDLKMFTVGDSSTNNGYGGDAGTQNYDAELEGTDGQLLLYGNDHCLRTDPFKFPGALSSDVKTVTFYIGNEYIKAESYDMYGHKLEKYDLCSDCFFALNGQVDINPDQYLYVSVNRVIQDGWPSRNGYGVCAVKASWPCPCPVPPCP